jgi:hypothetical protein
VGRPSPSSDALRQAFRTEVERQQRRSDGTFTLESVRFEVPSRYRHLHTLTVRYARWDLASVDLYDARHGTRLCAVWPLDKAAHADRRRRVLEPLAAPATSTAPQADAPAEMAPRLRELLAQYAATGLPPAYLPQDPPVAHPAPTLTKETP